MASHAVHESKDIRNVALVGHTGSGKTVLAEAMLCAGGVVQELGVIERGSTVSDNTVEEKEAGRSITMSVLHVPWKGRHGDVLVNIIDAPGFFDFAGQVAGALSAVEMALITVNANSGVEVATRKMWEAAGGLGLARALVVTRLDGENARFADVLESIKGAFGQACVPASIPDGEGSSFAGVIDLLDADPPAGGGARLSGDAASMKETLLESAISADDELLEKYLEGEELLPEALEAAMRLAITTGALVPVLSVSSLKGEASGVDALLDFIARYAPTPFDARPREEPSASADADADAEADADAAVADGHDAEGALFEPKPDGPLVARVFKTMSDEYVGKVSFFRVYQGSLKAGSTIHMPEGATAKVAKLYRFQGKDQEEVTGAVAGEIVATAKIENLSFGMTARDAPEGTALAVPAVPKPVVERAVEPKTRGDEAKISNALRKLADEDPTFEWRQDAQTKETVVTGLGDQHLKVMFDRMKRRFQLDVNTRPPKIAYRETIVGHADVRYRHKKQTGGAGQFAEVSIRIEPNERGAGYEFIDDIFGGSIDQPFRPSVDKGIQAKMADGIFAGYPVVDIKVSLYDGKTHPVDSKDIAFQIAGREAIKEAVMKAKPVLIEPIVNMEIAAPGRFMGDITGDISSRRGKILGMESVGDVQVVKAQAPAAEIQTYGAELQSLTGGEGFFSLEFSHYGVVPSNIAQQVIARRAKEKEGD